MLSVISETELTVYVVIAKSCHTGILYLVSCDPTKIRKKIITVHFPFRLSGFFFNLGKTAISVMLRDTWPNVTKFTSSHSVGM